MMKNIKTFIIIFLVCSVQVMAQQKELSSNITTTHLKWVQEQLRAPQNNKVLISAHRGDWRHTPENSLQSLRQCIAKQYDIVECDLKMSKDSHLIMMHDKTIDRTTNGKGKPEEYTLAALKTFKLTSGTGHITRHQIPTLEEYLIEAKGKAILCLDKGFEYYAAAMKLIRKYDMEDQVIFNIPAITLDSLQRMQLAKPDDRLVLNLLGFPQDTTKGNTLINAYRGRKYTIFHPTFSSDTIPLLKWLPSVKRAGIHLWLNALWPEHNAGHDDDIAVEENKPEETWGWLIQQGATIIQTDRPEALLKYLKEKGYRY